MRNGSSRLRAAADPGGSGACGQTAIPLALKRLLFSRIHAYRMHMAVPPPTYQWKARLKSRTQCGSFPNML